MSVLIVTGIYPPDIGGPANFSPEFANLLYKNNTEVGVITLSDDTKTNTQSNFSVKRIQRKNRLLRHFRVVFWVFTLSKKYDCIIATGLYEEVAIATLFRKKNITMRIVGDPVWERAKNRNKTRENIENFIPENFKEKLQRSILTWSINRGTIVITPSHQLESLMHNWGVKKPIHVIPNGTQIPDSRSIFERYLAISVSRLVHWKNIELALRLAKVCEISIKVVGDGPLESMLKSEFESETIQFVGRKNKTEVHELLGKSNIFILLSSYEGQSFALTEALSHGMFCIVSNVPGNTQLIRHKENGFIFNLQDVDGSMRELKRLLVDREKVKLIAAEARRFAEEELDSRKTFEQVQNLVLSK